MSNKFVKKTVSAIAIAMLMISTFAVLSSVFAIGHPAISMWIDPAAINLDTGSTSPGYTFWVTVWLNATGGDIGSWQFKMLYPKAYLKALQCVLTGTDGLRSQFFENSGTTTFPPPPVIDEYYDATRNYTLAGESWFSGPHGTGLGSLSKVQFEVVAAPPKGGSIADLIDISTTFPADTYAQDFTSSANVVTAVYNCNYNYLWLQPPSPYLAVLPTSQTFGPYDNVTGWPVDVDIYINSLSAAWYLVNASFALNYDPELLAVSNVAINATDWNVADKSSFAAIVKGADRLVALQSSTDYGWDWDVTGLTAHSGSPSATNLYGVTALGLLDAYEQTGDMAYFNASKDVADWMAWGNASEGDFYNGHDGFYFGYPEDYVFLVRFADISGNTTYADYAVDAWNWVKENHGTYYGDGNQTAMYNYNYGHYGTHGGAIWNTADFALAALACGDTEWAVNMTEVIVANMTKITGSDDYRFIGWGKALLAFQAVDPTGYATEIADIVGILASDPTFGQKADGSFDGWVQSEAYVIMGLVAVGEFEMAKKAAEWLIVSQGYDTIVGGWKLPDGKEYSEVTSEAFQAIYDVLQIGKIIFFVETSKALSGNVKVADVTFEIIYQGEYPTTNTSELTFSNAVLKDHTMLIPTGTSLEGEIIIKGLLTLPLPHLEVVPASTVIGPEPSMGKEFTVNVDIKDLHVAWKLVGTNFRLSYDDTLLEVVSVTPGTFLDKTSWGKIALGTMTVPQAEAPTWVGIVRLLLKVVTTRIGTYTFSITAPTGITVLINSVATTTFSVNCLSPPLVTFKLIEFRNYNVYPITGPYEIKVTPTTWGAEMAGTYDISLYWDPSVNKTVYPTWWSWLNGTKYANVTYPHHWDLMNWWVTEGSLKSITYAEINGWTNPAMYADSGNVSYKTFMSNTYMADSDLANPGNDPDIVTVIPWIRNVGVPPWSWTFSDVLPPNSLPAHVAVGAMLATDSGNWYIFPEGSGTLATIKFKVIKQACEDLKCNLTLFDITMLDKDGMEIPYEDPVSGTYKILAFSLPGRQIDLYTQYPAPYGGQGPNKPSDMFVPQQEVVLYAKVTYNSWPIQYKPVAYEITDPQGKVWDKKTAFTNDVGVAEARFRMPWPCENPEALFGKWNVTATVEIAQIVVNDTLQFHYNYLVNIFKVTTDALEYAHLDTITITAKITSLAMQFYMNVLVTAAIVDELGVTVGFFSKAINVTGATFCTPKTYTVTFTITIPKFAVAGLATVHVNCFDKEPSVGGVALCPEYTPVPEIYIEPY